MSQKLYVGVDLIINTTTTPFGVTWVNKSDHPSNTKRGGGCIYYEESLAVRLVDITSLPECLVCEITI